MNAPTDWTSALAILAAGLILGTLVVFAARRRKASAATRRRELEARRDALVAQLRGLGDDVVDEDRAWLEKETAEVLRALDRLPAAPAEEKPAPKPRSATAGFVWGVACTLAIGGIAWYASTFTRDDTNAGTRIAQAKDAFVKNDLMAAQQEPAPRAALPPDHPPLPGSEVRMPAAAGTAQPIHLTLSLDPSMPPRGGTIYVIARGNEGGHPVAVRRIDTNDFPVTLDFGGADDSMMGGTLPEKIRIEARLDADGDAGTTDPADLRAIAENVRGGSTIELRLARVN